MATLNSLKLDFATSARIFTVSVNGNPINRNISACVLDEE